MAVSAFRNIYLIGPMGAGKTTIGRQLAKHLGKPFYDSDIEVETRCGTSISWIFDIEGEAGFRQREPHVIHELCQLQDVVLSTGGGSILYCENLEECLERTKYYLLKISLSCLNDLNSKALPKGSLKNIVFCSPGSPSNLT